MNFSHMDPFATQGPGLEDSLAGKVLAQCSVLNEHGPTGSHWNVGTHCSHQSLEHVTLDQ